MKSTSTWDDDEDLPMGPPPGFDKLRNLAGAYGGEYGPALWLIQRHPDAARLVRRITGWNPEKACEERGDFYPGVCAVAVTEPDSSWHGAFRAMSSGDQRVIRTIATIGATDVPWTAHEMLGLEEGLVRDILTIYQLRAIGAWS